MLRAQAAILETREDVETAPPGLYVARSGTPAYFPLLALIETGEADLAGELFEDGARVVTVEVTSTPEYSLGQDAPKPNAITIGRNFFITALKDYRDWPIKWWREAIQNSVDAGAENVALGVIQNPDGTWTISCEDDGRGMSTDVIKNKFLVLGATTKAEEAGVGGFGKAKELLLLPWISWRVHSRDTVVEGAGVGYEDPKRDYMRHGTRLEVVMPADRTTTEAMAIAFVERCYLPHVSFTVNGEPHLADLAARDVIQSIEGKVDILFSPSAVQQPYAYVRAHGVFMFERHIGDIPGYLIAELTAPSVEILTANRDGFRDWEVTHALDKLAEKIAKDNLSALRSKQGLIRQKFEGAGKFRAKRLAAGLLEQVGPSPKLTQQDEQGIIHAITDYHRQDEQAQRPTNVPSPETAAAMLDVKIQGPSHLEAAIKQLVWEPDFYVINDIEGFKVPKKFFPATMTPRVLKLAKTWVELCRFVFIQLGSDVDFGVGFIFSPSTAAAAMHEEEERWLMLNPFKGMTESDIWRPAHDPDLKWLYAAAIHEATHIADYINYHDESFASAFTRNAARCADGYRKIRQIVAGIRMHGGPEADV